MRALITGITGQDGSLLGGALLSKGYEVFGIVRRSSVKKFDRIEALVDDIKLVEGDLTDQSSLDSVMHSVQPDEVYNLPRRALCGIVEPACVDGRCNRAGSGCGSWKAIRKHGPRRSSCKRPVRRCSAKCAKPRRRKKLRFIRAALRRGQGVRHYITVNYRESYGLFACSANWIQPRIARRGLEFVTRKVTHQVARIKCGHAKNSRWESRRAARLGLCSRLCARDVDDATAVGTGGLRPGYREDAQYSRATAAAFGAVGLTGRSMSRSIPS